MPRGHSLAAEHYFDTTSTDVVRITQTALSFQSVITLKSSTRGKGSCSAS
jgi:hypothetical protein